MNWKALLVGLAAVLTLVPSVSEAQGRQRPGSSGGMQAAAEHRAELIGFGGYVWASGRDFYSPYYNRSGTADVKSSFYWGGELNLNVVPGGQVILMYRRQDSDLEFKSGFDRISQPMATEYYQIGGLGFFPGADLGAAKPFSSISLGATRYAIKGFDDHWKFSVIFGLGLKAYVSERVGILLRGTLPMTFFSGGGSIGCGSGGCYTSVGGSGLLQVDVSAGIMLLL